jgi:hypothetical protein
MGASFSRVDFVLMAAVNVKKPGSRLIPGPPKSLIGAEDPYI